MPTSAILVVFGGLPGTGKTTIAKRLAAELDAAYVRIDTIDQAMRNSGMSSERLGAAGYVVANGIASDNLRNGRSVVADCVNPVAESRKAWSQVAAASGAAMIDIEVVCSDLREHRRRVEQRQGDIAGLAPPTWQSVIDHDYEARTDQRLTVDTAHLAPGQAVEMIVEHLRTMEFTSDTDVLVSK